MKKQLGPSLAEPKATNEKQEKVGDYEFIDAYPTNTTIQKAYDAAM